MNIDLLRSFVALALTHSFSIAAKQLFISQSTLTRRIQALEKSLGLSLFNRTQPLTLTKEGEALLVPAQEALDAFDKFYDKAQGLLDFPSQSIAIQDATYSTFFLNLTQRLMESFQLNHPNVVFSYAALPANKTLEAALEEGLVDVAIMPIFESDPTIINQDLSKDIGAIEFVDFRKNLAFEVRSDNPLLRSNPTTIADFSSAHFISGLTDWLKTSRENFTAFCEKEGGFTPIFDFRSFSHPNSFYSQDQGKSIYIVGQPLPGQQEEPITGKTVQEHSTRIVFPDIYAKTILLYSKHRASETLFEFLQQLNRPTINKFDE